ncbi:PREDICTED: uncharacterized protein LOC107118668 [Gekko japonicus]|uniref:Uncharacterized protein LOC107118668 n=1 Tax=Gekko japonicus TaxID=146911 RepID=A0ABM1KS26_GEKJA|nr:PREDICTED: uncharacterized protein LOC107118668 [Gekko japonicus]
MFWMPEGNPQPGDLIEIFQPECQHWAIYISNGYVVHLVPQGNCSGSDIPSLLSSGTSGLGSVMHDHAEVKMEPLWKVADNGYQINNKYDAKYKPRHVREIIFKAKAAVGTKMSYNFCEHFVTNLRYGIPFSDQVNPQPGDLIEISRTACQHWAIYAGNGYVVHLVPTGNPSGSDIPSLLSSGISILGSYGTSDLRSVMHDHAEVKMEPLWKVVENRYQINNKYDTKYKPRPVREIVSKAKAAVGTKMPYNVLNNNCEHFVTNLRYGKPVSDQADSKKFSVTTVCAAICTAAFYANPIGTVAVAGSALLLHNFWRRRQHEHE